MRLVVEALARVVFPVTSRVDARVVAPVTASVPVAVTLPPKCEFPFTVKRAVGDVVPMPTLPLVSIVILVALLVSNARLFESLVPSVAVVPKEFPPCWKKLPAKVEVATQAVPDPVEERIIPEVPADAAESKSEPVKRAEPTTVKV